MRKSTQIFGSQRKLKETLEVCVLQKNYVLSVRIDLNAPNGVLPMNDTEFGADYLLVKENKYVVKET